MHFKMWFQVPSPSDPVSQDKVIQLNHNDMINQDIYLLTLIEHNLGPSESMRCRQNIVGSFLCIFCSFSLSTVVTSRRGVLQFLNFACNPQQEKESDCTLIENSDNPLHPLIYIFGGELNISS